MIEGGREGEWDGRKEQVSGKEREGVSDGRRERGKRE